MTQRVLTRDELETVQGETIVESPWILIDQGRIDAFAAATDDDQYIHTNPAACADGQGFMGRSETVAHGKLTSSLAVGQMVRAVCLEGHQFINMKDSTIYKRPVPAGWLVQVKGGIAQYEDVRGGIQLIVELFVDVSEPGSDHHKRAADVTVTVLARPIE